MHEMKLDIWHGMRHAEVAAKYKVSYQTGAAVKAGRLYEYVPWPNGENGPLPAWRAAELTTAKRLETRTEKVLIKKGYMNGDHVEKAETLTQEAKWDLDVTAHKLGYKNYRDMFEMERIKRINRISDEIAERTRKELEEYRIKQAAWEAAGRPQEPSPNANALPDDMCDPDGCEMIEWDEVVLLGKHLPIVMIAIKDTENSEPALAPALRIVLKMFSQRQWKEDHVLRMIYSVKAKIERFWQAKGLM